MIARAYAQLSTCRPIGMGGIGPIPITAVWEWEDRKGLIDRSVRDHFEAVIAAVDMTTLQRANRPPSDTKGTVEKPRRSKR
jgi:hypothetical protein